jgi:hypothetical protein
MKIIIYKFIINIVMNNLINLINDKPNVKSTGSKIALGGYKEEEFLVNTLNSDVKLLEELKKFIGKEIKNDAKLIIGNKKSDIVVSSINIQHKKTKTKQFGQIDRHYVDHLIDKLPALNECKNMLLNLCELPIDPVTKLCDKKFKIKKIDNSNYTDNEINNLINIFEINKKDILNYAFNGYYDDYRPDIISISLFNKNNKREKIIFWKMTDVITHLMNFNVEIKNSKTVIKISDGLTFQRKGGDGGKKQGNNFQFKFIPSSLPLDKALIYKL